MILNRQKIAEQLIVDEGVVFEVYQDSLGFPTFGVGHLIREGDPEYGLPIGAEILESRVWETFEDDIEVAISECKMLYGDYTFAKFPGEVQEVLVNMMFNLGRTKLSKFRKMYRHLQNGDWGFAAMEGRDSLWYKQVTDRAERLMSRLEKVV